MRHCTTIVGNPTPTRYAGHHVYCMGFGYREAGIDMHALTQDSSPRLSPELSPEVRLRAGRQLRDLREKRGLTQRALAQKVGAEYYTVVSQLEHGRGHIPSGLCLIWAQALGVESGEFARMLGVLYQVEAVMGDDPPAARMLDSRDRCNFRFRATEAE